MCVDWFVITGRGGLWENPNVLRVSSARTFGCSSYVVLFPGICSGNGHGPLNDRTIDDGDRYRGNPQNSFAKHGLF